MINYKFSVLMSVYYKEKINYFKTAFDSILNQTISPDEIVLIEDGPISQELEEIINCYKEKVEKLKIIKLEKNLGLGEALKIGIKNCKYNLIARMDTDDIAKNNRFEKQLNIFKKFPEIDVVGSNTEEFEEINGQRKIIRLKKLPQSNEKILKKLKKCNALNHPTVMYKKNKVLSSGNYSGEYKRLEDYHLWVKMALNNCKFYNIQEPLLYFRVTDESFKRRSGIKKMIEDFKFHKLLFDLKFINFYEFLRNIFLWMVYRIIPKGIVKILKKNLNSN